MSFTVHSLSSLNTCSAAGIPDVDLGSSLPRFIVFALSGEESSCERRVETGKYPSVFGRVPVVRVVIPAFAVTSPE